MKPFQNPGFLRKRIEKRHPIVRELPVDCIEKNRDESEPGSWRCAASLVCSEQGFKHCPFVTVFRDFMNGFHVVAHHTEQSFSTCLDCVSWHTKTSHCQHSKSHNDVVVTCGGDVVKGGKVGMALATEIIGQLFEQNRVHSRPVFSRAKVLVIETLVLLLVCLTRCDPH
jgi:hypothetical protein